VRLNIFQGFQYKYDKLICWIIYLMGILTLIIHPKIPFWHFKHFFIKQLMKLSLNWFILILRFKHLIFFHKINKLVVLTN